MGRPAAVEDRSAPRVHELVGRHFGWRRRQKPATQIQFAEYLPRRALRSQGVVSLDLIWHGNVPSKPLISGLIVTLIQRNSLVPSPQKPRKNSTLDRAGRAGRNSQSAQGHASPHPLAVRPTRDAARMTQPILRLRTSLRGVCSGRQTGVRLFCAAGAGRRRDRGRARPYGGPPGPQTASPKWTWIAKRRAGLATEEALAPFERFQMA